MKDIILGFIFIIVIVANGGLFLVGVSDGVNLQNGSIHRMLGFTKDCSPKLKVHYAFPGSIAGCYVGKFLNEKV